ncbi:MULTISPECIES: antibiotic biosynthesis monooxygenase family protein [Aneurinibacillus]|nr:MULTISPECIES: antibiotic biosynthesis monooxygenase [Aneurinibacillus]MED0678192.1 antibiotic biosynthesis monooxygenase [Aneurinibacillus thermoaerophilus]
MNVLQVPAEGKERMAEMFAKSVERMKQVPGCLEFQFLSAKGADKQIVYTKWDSEESFRAWTESEGFRQAHAHASNNNPATGSQLEIYEVLHGATYDK